MASHTRATAVSVLTLALLLGGAASGWAQEREGDEAAAAPREAIEEIIVTAEKTERRLQDTALSIQAFDADDLNRRGITDSWEIGDFTPGFTFLPGTNGNVMTSFTGRGSGSRDNNPLNTQTVGLYVDGVYIGTGMGASFDLLDIERIEVLKGPQGTNFGRNTIGGAVSIISKKPGPELGGYVQATAGMHDERTVRATVNVPMVGETLMSRLSFVSKSRGPFFKNTWGPDDYDDLGETGGRAAVRWLASDTLTADWTFERIEIDNHNPAFQLTSVTPTLEFVVPGTSAFIRRDNGSIPTNDEQYIRLNSWLNTLTLTWDAAENLELKSITGWKKYRLSGANDLDGSPLRLFRSGQHQDHRTFYQEVQATGKLLEERLEYYAGSTWFEEESDSDNWMGFAEDWFQGVGNTTTNAKGDNYAWGIYGQGTYHATEKLELTGGLRFSKERKSINRSLCGTSYMFIEGEPVPTAFNRDLVPVHACGSGGIFTGAPLFLEDRRDFRSDNWSPLLRLAYHWDEDVMTYVSWTRGYRSGGYNIRFTDASGLPRYDDETVAQWEAGIKSGWLDNRLQLNASGFYSEYEDMQVASWASSGTVWNNAGKARIRGWEVDLLTAPLDGLRLRLTHAWTNAEFVEYEEDDPNTANFDLSNRRQRHRIAVQPKRTYAGVATYELPPTDFGTLEISGNFRRMSPTGYLDQVAQWHNTKNGPYTVYGGRIGLYDAFGIEGASVAVIGRNITDRSYIDNGIDFSSEGQPIFFSGNTYGDPRHVVVQVGYEF